MRFDEQGLHLRQSDINEWLNCPERFRRSIVESESEQPISHESDAALVGTVIHAAIEYEFLNGPQDRSKLDEIALHMYAKMCEEFRNNETISFNEASYGGKDSKAYEDIVGLVEKWFSSDIRHKYLKHDNVLVEWSFDVPLCRINGVEIFLTGTSDLVIPNVAVIDWKTAGREYQRWEKQRWAVQPSVYTYAAHYENLFDHQPIAFTFHVFTRGRAGDVQNVECWRGQEHWEWLRNQIGPLVTQLIDARDRGWVGAWQMNDQHALCSDKWCPYWSSCKGAHMKEGWDK
jgi:hypothetical protein